MKWLQPSLVFAVFFGISSSIFAYTVKVNNFDVYPTKKSFKVNFTLVKLKKSLIQTSTSPAAYKAQLAIYAEGNDPILPDGTIDKDDEFNDNFIWKLLTTPNVQDNGEKFLDLTFEIEIQQNPDREAGNEDQEPWNTLYVDRAIEIKTKFRKHDETFKETESVTVPKLIQVNAKPFQAPSQVTGVGRNQAIIASYKSNITSTYTKADKGENKSLQRVPGRVSFFIIKPDVKEVTFNTWTIDHESGEDQVSDKKCTYDPNFENKSKYNCVVCPDDDHYFLKAGPKDQPDTVMTKTVNNTKTAKGYHAFKITKGIENEKSYVMFAAYEEGAARSRCIRVPTSPSYSLSQLLGADDPTRGDDRCLIVSAAYNSPAHIHVETFRRFRDRFLLPFKWGREMIAAYYRNSASVAETIRTTPWLQTSVKTALFVPTGTMYAVDAVWEMPIWQHILLLLSCCYLSWIALRPKLRKPHKVLRKL